MGSGKIDDKIRYLIANKGQRLLQGWKSLVGTSDRVPFLGQIFGALRSPRLVLMYVIFLPPRSICNAIEELILEDCKGQ